MFFSLIHTEYFDNFKLEILEYCEKGANPVNREQYYLDLLKPEYNILNQAGSLLGFKHSEETLNYFFFPGGNGTTKSK